jgi:hypothetical protein
MMDIRILTRVAWFVPPMKTRIMKSPCILKCIVSALLLIFATAPAQCGPGSRLVEDKFDVLQTRTGTYTNVTVTTRAEKYIFIHHSSGMCNVKIKDLPVEIREELGYAVSAAATPQKNNAITSVAARELTQVNRNLKPLAENWKLQWRRHAPAFKISSEVLLTLLVILLLVYLFVCYCCHLICVKAKSPASLLVWVPGLQMIPLLRAAGMSGWWFLALFVPLLNIVMQILWSVNIVKAREKGVVCTILLILPVTSVFAFLYLAFSGTSSSDAPSPKFQTRAFQTA